MKSQLLLPLACFTFLSIFSCEKSEIVPKGTCSVGCLTFEGSVRSAGKDSMVSGVVVKLHKEIDTFLGLKSKIGETTTDADGKYSINIDGANYSRGNHDFELSFYHPNYIMSQVDSEVRYYDIDSSNFDKPIIKNLVFFPIAYVKVSISKQNFSLLKMNFSKKYNHTVYSWGFNMNTRDTSVIYQIAGDTITSFGCSNSNSHQKLLSEKINIAAGDTAFFKISL